MKLRISNPTGPDFDTDGTLAANSDILVATQKAVKTYVDATVAGALNVPSGVPAPPTGLAGTTGGA